MLFYVKHNKLFSVNGVSQKGCALIEGFGAA